MAANVGPKSTIMVGSIGSFGFLFVWFGCVLFCVFFCFCVFLLNDLQFMRDFSQLFKTKTRMSEGELRKTHISGTFTADSNVAFLHSALITGFGQVLIFVLCLCLIPCCMGKAEKYVLF